MEYLFHVVVIISIYAVLASSLDLIAGHAGLVSVSHAAFYGLGAYMAALVTVYFRAHFLLGMLAGITVVVAASLVVSLPSLRLRDDYFAIATFAFQLILSNLLNDWVTVTRGALGISGIPRPVIFGWEPRSNLEFAALGLSLVAVAHVVVGRLTTSPFGRVLRAIREDEVFAQSLGKDTLRFKVTVFGIAAMLASCAGALYAHYMTYIDATSFTLNESMLVLSMVIIGGAGSRWGPLFGAAVLVIIPEALRFVGFPGPLAAKLRQLSYGGLLVFMLMVRPRGLVGRYGFGR